MPDRGPGTEGPVSDLFDGPTVKELPSRHMTFLISWPPRQPNFTVKVIGTSGVQQRVD